MTEIKLFLVVQFASVSEDMLNIKCEYKRFMGQASVTLVSVPLCHPRSSHALAAIAADGAVDGKNTWQQSLLPGAAVAL